MNGDAGMGAGALRRVFVLAWLLWLGAKVYLAAHLAPFGDEAFYAWEARHPAWAYSDLPGLTAALIRVATSLAGNDVFVWRLPFLLLAALMPWQVAGLARRWFGEGAGWRAGLLSMLLPMSAVLGVLALPDVPLVFAALLCVEGLARLAERSSGHAALLLALGLVTGALAHYRFAAVVLAGGMGVWVLADRQRLLRSGSLWAAIAVGAAAWLPLLMWNAQHGGAGLSFQLVDRHPWQFHLDGGFWPLVQASVLTPGLFLLMLLVWVKCWRGWRREPAGPWGLLCVAGGAASLAFWPLAFFVDSERLSLHWPYAGWLLLLTAAPAVLAGWPRWLRLSTLGLALVGALGVNAYLLLATRTEWRAPLAASEFYPDNFSGWPEIVARIAAERQAKPGLQVLADNFMLAAQLATALDLDPNELQVLDHPLNAKHGRATQLALWGYASTERGNSVAARPRLLVVEDSARPLKDRLRAYHALCARFGGLPPADILHLDHGRKRFLLFALDASNSKTCVPPALAYLDSPEPDAASRSPLRVRGWAFKDGVGLRAVELSVDGEVVATARYGIAEPKVAAYWAGTTDPQHPRVGFAADLDLSGLASGRHWLGLRLHGRDGSIEDWPGQPFETR